MSNKKQDRAQWRIRTERITARRQLLDKSETRPQFIVRVKQDGGIAEKPMTCERSAEIIKRCKLT